MVCVGTGFSGVMLAYKYKYGYAMTNFLDLVIYEKNGDVGGTWLENKYPGVACDFPAHIYIFPFEPNPNWRSFYAERSGVWQYVKDTSDEYALDEMVRLKSRVIESIWDEQAGRWKTKVQHGQAYLTMKQMYWLTDQGF